MPGGIVFVFVTTRSRPADNRWLANLVQPLDDDPRIAGVCGRGLPRPEADLVTRRDDLYYASILAPRPGARAIRDWGEYRRLTPGELSRFTLFSNVGAAIRPEVFARIPFREASHGEDMIWAKDVLEAGLSICYEPSAVHLRSHQYSPVELL
jgi:rhamnosyltransferase